MTWIFGQNINDNDELQLKVGIVVERGWGVEGRCAWHGIDRYLICLACEYYVCRCDIPVRRCHIVELEVRSLMYLIIP